MSSDTGPWQQTPSVLGEPLPAQIGRYRVVGRLGSGGMGVVYKAIDPQLDRVVALKVPYFRGEPKSEAACAQRFYREARAAARVLHPNVYPILDVGEHEGHPFAVMAYVEGRSLEQRPAEAGAPEEPGTAVRLLLQVLEGLAAVHAAGLVHRDVKPANILLNTAGRVLLTDFGLARTADGSDLLTSDSIVVGTPHYMAPEQAAGQADRVGPRTDVYAAGVVLYRMLTGRRPFEGGPLAVLAKIANDPVPPPSCWRRDLPPGLEAVILRTLEKDPERRYAGAGAFAEVLRPWAAASQDAREGAAEKRRPPGPSAGTLPDLWRRTRSLFVWPRYLIGGALMLMLTVASEVALLILLGLPGGSLWKGLIFGVFAAGTVSSIMLLTLASLWRRALTPERLLRVCAVASQRRTNLWLVRDILRYGVDVNATDEIGETALQKATRSGQVGLVKELLAYGADAGHRNHFGHTALQIAERNRHADITDLLQRAGATE